MHKTFRQPLVGQRIRELRDQAGSSRIELASATAVSSSALVRLERGDDVRLSTYLAIVDYFLARDPEAWMLADRILLLPAEARVQINELVAWFGGSEHKGGEEDG